MQNTNKAKVMRLKDILENQIFFKSLLALKMSGVSIEVVAMLSWYYCHPQKLFAFKVILTNFCSAKKLLTEGLRI